MLKDKTRPGTDHVTNSKYSLIHYALQWEINQNQTNL